MDELLRTLALSAAVICNGLLAGVFFAFACATNPAMRRVDDQTYVQSVRAVNKAILNGWFLTVFVGSPLLAIAAVIVAPAGAPQMWAIGGLAAAIVSFMITAAVNVPLNNRLDAAPTQNPHQYAEARSGFEQRWNAAHNVRTLASIAATIALIVALVS